MKIEINRDILPHAQVLDIVLQIMDMADPETAWTMCLVTVQDLPVRRRFCPIYDAVARLRDSIAVSPDPEGTWAKVRWLTGRVSQSVDALHGELMMGETD